MKCEICGKEFKKGLWLHVYKAHGIKKAEYEEKYGKEIGEESVVEKAFYQEDIQEETIKDSLNEILNKYNISLDQMMAVLDREFAKKSEKSLQEEILEEIKKVEDDSLSEAKRLNGPDNLTTTKLPVADALVKHFNYTVTKVTSNPKTWYLEKKV